MDAPTSPDGVAGAQPPEAFGVRAATTGDAEAIARVWLTRHEGRIEDATRLIAGEIEMVAHGAGRLVCVAVRDEEIVAYGRARLWQPEEVAGYRACPAGWWLSGTLVLSPFRRRGIGAALVRARLQALSPPVHSKVDVANGVSRAWHASNGFEEVTRDFTSPRTRNPLEPMILMRWAGQDQRASTRARSTR
jgi:GNAT superfamily N-acetyltransferase